MELNRFGFFEQFGNPPSESEAETVRVIVPEKLTGDDVLSIDTALAREIVGHPLGGMARVRLAVAGLRAEFLKRGKPVKTRVPGLYGKNAGLVVFAVVPAFGGTSDAWRVREITKD